MEGDRVWLVLGEEGGPEVEGDGGEDARGYEAAVRN